MGHLHRAIENAGDAFPGRAWRAHAVLGRTSGDAEATAQAREIAEQVALSLEEPERSTFRLNFRA